MHGPSGKKIGPRETSTSVHLSEGAQIIVRVNADAQTLAFEFVPPKGQATGNFVDGPASSCPPPHACGLGLTGQEDGDQVRLVKAGLLSQGPEIGCAQGQAAVPTSSLRSLLASSAVRPSRTVAMAAAGAEAGLLSQGPEIG